MAELKMDIKTAMANQETWLQGIAEAKRIYNDPTTPPDKKAEARKEMKHCKASVIPYTGDVIYDFVRDSDGNIVRKANHVEYDYNSIRQSKIGFVQLKCKEAQEQRDADAKRSKTYSETFENFDETRCKEAYKQAVAYSMSPNTFFSERGWLIITGKEGSGKTHLAYGIANRLAEADIPSMIGTLGQHLDSIEEEEYRGLPEIYYLRMETTPMLVIDGLGDSPLTAEERELLESITKRRCDYKLPTVFTTRLSFSDFCTFVGGDISRRMNQRATEIDTGH